MSQNANVKKIRPFPIKANLKDRRGSYEGHVVKLTLQGLMIEVLGTSVQPGEIVEVAFVTPVLNGAISVAGVVVKVYNQLVSSVESPSTGPVVSAASTSTGGATAGPTGTFDLIEMHFRSPSPESMGRIGQFLESIGQARRR